MLRHLLTIILLWPSISIAAGPDDRSPWLKEILESKLHQLESSLAIATQTIETRNLAAGALTSLVLHENSQKAEKLLQTLFRAQNVDTSSPEYGKIPWQIRGSEGYDWNAIEFCAQTLGPLYLRYPNRLSPSFFQESLPHLKAAIAAIKRHHPGIHHTNIFLMAATNLILLGQVVHDAQAVGTGEEMMDQWLKSTRQTGILEYDSPTYYGTDTDSLLWGYLFAEKPQTKRNMRSALDYLWTDIAANFFPGQGGLSGPHSRDYNSLTDRGRIDVYTYIFGWRRTLPKQSPDLMMASLLMNGPDGGYRPTPEMKSLINQKERVVVQTWGTEAGQDRYNYLTQDFAIGSVSHDYGPQDKPISIELKSAKVLANIQVVPDDTDYPYGMIESYHLPLRPVSVQNRGTLLSLLFIAPDKERHSSSLATNILLPLWAQAIYLDNQKMDLNAIGEARLTENSVVIVREGETGVAMRVFTATGCGSSAPQMVLKVDKAGREYGVARVTVYHSKVEAPEDCKARVGLLFSATRLGERLGVKELADRMGRARLQEDFHNGIWTVEAEVDGEKLEASRDFGNIFYRRVNGLELKFEAFKVYVLQ